MNDEREGGLIALGKELQRKQGRLRPWSHSALSNFAHGKSPPTIELTEALGTFFGLPSPVYFARSLPEALELAKVKEKYDKMPVADDVEDAEVLAFAQKRARAEVEKKTTVEQAATAKPRKNVG